MPFMRFFRTGLLLTLIGYWIAMAVLTHLPKVPGVPQMGDKTTHFVGFAALGALLYLCALATGRASSWTGLFVLTIVSLYAAFDEITQPLTGRSCSFVDWMADLSGAAAAVMVMGNAHWAVLRVWRNTRS